MLYYITQIYSNNKNVSLFFLIFAQNKLFSDQYSQQKKERKM